METARRLDLALLASTASFLTLLLFAASATAWEATAWRTADGRLYFGSAPPPGSVQTTEIRVVASRVEAPRARIDVPPAPRIEAPRTARVEASRTSRVETPLASRVEEPRLAERKVRERRRETVLVAATPPQAPRVRTDGIAFVATPRTVGEGEHRALTTCVRNDGRETKRVWMVGPERVPVGVIAPAGVKCVTVPAPRVSVGASDFWLEAEPANGA